MDGTVIGLYLLATFIGGVTTGLAGFAMGLVVSGIWLHILTPMQTAALIVGYALLVQTYSIWKVRHALSWRKVTPFIVGGAAGVPVGAVLLAHINPAHLRMDNESGSRPKPLGTRRTLDCCGSTLRPLKSCAA